MAHRNISTTVTMPPAVVLPETVVKSSSPKPAMRPMTSAAMKAIASPSIEDGTYNVGKVYFSGKGDPDIHVYGTCRYVHELQRIFKVQHVNTTIVI